MSLISDRESRVSNVEKYVCKSGCTICTTGQKCTVWRNKVIRITIGIEKLKFYHDRKFILEKVEKLNDFTDLELSKDRESQLVSALLNKGLIVRLNSKWVKEYIQTIDPLARSNLPSIIEIIEKERQEINEQLSNIQLFFKSKDIEFEGTSELLIRDFISSLIEIDKYLNTHKINEIKSVWSFNEIICKERYEYYKENYQTLNLIKLLEELNKYKIPFRENNYNYKCNYDNNYKNFYHSLEKQFQLKGLSINHIIQHESDTILKILEILEPKFHSRGIQFNIESERVQSFISKTSSLNCDSFNKQLSSLLSKMK
ncbi:hypothetical protein ACTFIY_011290 [Dictyostelium cf. discoideum]